MSLCHYLQPVFGSPPDASLTLADRLRHPASSEQLANGEKPAKEVTEAAEAEGISQVTLQRAKKALGIQTWKSGMHGGWMWKLPEDNHEQGQRV